MKSERTNSERDDTFNEINLFVEDIKKRAAPAYINRHEEYKSLVLKLDAVNRLCKEIYEKNYLWFPNPNTHIKSELYKLGFGKDLQIKYNPYKKIVEAWRKAAELRNEKTRPLLEKGPFPEIDNLIENLKYKLRPRKLLSPEDLAIFISCVELANKVCREIYEKGEELNFSGGVIYPIMRQRGAPENFDLVNDQRIRTILKAWMIACNGFSFKPDQYAKSKDVESLIAYIDAHFENFGYLPSNIRIKSEGYSASRLAQLSPSKLSTDTALALIKWEKHKLEQLPKDVVQICEQWLDAKKSVPSPKDLAGLFNLDNSSDTLIGIAIDKWRRIRFATQISKIESSKIDNQYVWVELHPELCEWRPILISFFAAKQTVTAKKVFNSAMINFLVSYLLAQNMPLTPKRFLSKDFNGANCLLKSGVLTGEDDWAKRKWISVHRLLEYVLDSWPGFIQIDEHGHTVRNEKYHNPIPPLFGRDTKLRSSKITIARGAYQDPEMKYLTDKNPGMEQWRQYAVEYLNAATSSLYMKERALQLFLVDYVLGQRLPVDPNIFLSLGWNAENKLPSLENTIYAGLSSKAIKSDTQQIIAFIDFVLEKYFTAEDDYGRRVVSGDYFNPIINLGGEIISTPYNDLSKSNKQVLPSRYLRILRALLVPEDATNFNDMKWVQNNSEGDWFEVSLEHIDRDDPDCVWRLRTVSRVERDDKGFVIPKSNQQCEVYEMWSPSRTVALLLKLELPLRTYQVRLLDSGEGDTWRYSGSYITKSEIGEKKYNAGGFIKNSSSAVQDIGNTERHAGLFRRMSDGVTGKTYAGLYINTNKTADRNKEQWDRGHEIPWQHCKVLYWCEKLRNWQEKYNPVASPVAITSLPRNIVGPKTLVQKRQMGTMYFLFRNAAAKEKFGLSKAWPLAESSLATIWSRLLIELENICVAKGYTAIDGSKLLFVPENRSTWNVRTFYPLHSLRVSLITHFATEGGVEMHILSECIVGHARIIMTLYYKKSGITHVSEAMNAASNKIQSKEQDNYIRWLKDASLAQLEVNGASIDTSVFEAIKDGFNNGSTSLLRTNLGLCAKGGQGCHDGGIYYDENTGAATYGEVPGPPEKNCVRCRWFMTGPAFLPALVHHWNVLHFNLGGSGQKYLEIDQEIAELEGALFDCQKLNVPFEWESKLEELRHAHAATYDGNERLAADSLSTMKLIVRCKRIVDISNDHESGVHLVAVGGIEEVGINVRECNELEQVLTTGLGATIYAQPDVSKAVTKAGNAFDRMLAMNGKDPIFFKLSDKELPIVVAHLTRLLQAYAGSIGRAVPFIEGAVKLSQLGLFGETDEILNLASAGTPLRLISKDEQGPLLSADGIKLIPLKFIEGELENGN